MLPRVLMASQQSSSATARILRQRSFQCLRTCSTNTSSVLYPGHISTSPFQKLLLTGLSSAIAITDPARDDMICAMGEASGSCALSRMKRRMENDSQGRQILKEKPIISKETVDLEYLSQLDEKSLGKAYWNFLQINGFDPDARRPVNFVDDVELAYVMLRYRQLHDLTHTILGMKPNMLGEVAVKWFEAIQTGLPMCISAAIAGPVRLGPKHGKLWRRQLFLWSVQNGYNAKSFMNLYVEKYWETPLSELRNQLGVVPPPCNSLD